MTCSVVEEITQLYINDWWLKLCCREGNKNLKYIKKQNTAIAPHYGVMENKQTNPFKMARLKLQGKYYKKR